MKTTQVLVAGDSITLGSIGFNYLPVGSESKPGFIFTNLGKNGDTLVGIGKRTLEALAQNRDYDILVLVAGHNDVILPHFAAKPFPYNMVSKEADKSGSVPTPDPLAFETEYRTLLGKIRRLYSRRIVISTLSSVNEHPQSQPAIHRSTLNSAIRRLAHEEPVAGLSLMDVGADFDAQLGDKSTRDYLLENLVAMGTTDRLWSRSEAGGMKLSRRRGLHLTIDGVHLNPTGAQLYWRTLEVVLATW